MRSGRILCSLLILATSVPVVASRRARRSPTSPKLYSKQHSKASSKHTSGQRSIDDSRASEIQTALVHSGYLSSDAASGHWDSQTKAAMQKFQSDNGWQTKLVPDSRAIIKLGLGPSQDKSPAQGFEESSLPSSMDTASGSSLQ